MVESKSVGIHFVALVGKLLGLLAPDPLSFVDPLAPDPLPFLDPLLLDMYATMN